MPFPHNAVLVSKTDTRGTITYVNDAFAEISGYSREDMIGKNHNIIRHPDMPPQTFKWMWDTLKSERPWRGTVKNRAKSGDYYWVRATVAPIIEHGSIVGYVSVRKKPTRKQIDEAERLYEKLNRAGTPIESKYERFKFKNWPLAGKIGLFIQATLLTVLTTAQIYISNDMREESRALAREKGSQLTESIMDSENMLMVTGQIENAGNRELLIQKILANKQVKSAQMVRAEAVVKQYGEGLPTERISNELQRRAVISKESIVEIIRDNEGWPVVRVVTPFLASKNFHGTDCTSCHAAAEGEVMGAADVAISLKDDFERIRNMEVLMIYGQIALQVFLYFFIGWFVRKYIGRPLGDIHAEFRHIMEGNLDTELGISTGDELGGALCDIQSMQTYLRTTVDEIVVPVSRMQSRLTALSRQVSVVADNSTAEQQHIQSIAASMEQLSCSVSEVADMASGSLADAMNMKNIVERNNADMERSVVASTKVGLSAQASSKAIAELGDSIQKIGIISNSIKDIAEQTNLLALNAAIEAARAGEQGRGFAVVADEVRKLAERTAASTKNIATIVAEIDSISEGAVSTMLQTKGEADESIALIRKCGDGLREVSAATANMVEHVEHIAAASREQDAAGKSVAGSLEQMSGLVERNAELSRLSKESAADIEVSAKELKKAGYPLTKCAANYE